MEVDVAKDGLLLKIHWSKQAFLIYFRIYVVRIKLYTKASGFLLLANTFLQYTIE